jgi:hypothetical protein
LAPAKFDSHRDNDAFGAVMDVLVVAVVARAVAAVRRLRAVHGWKRRCSVLMNGVAAV